MLKYEEWVDVDDEEMRKELEKSDPIILSSIFKERYTRRKHSKGHDYVYEYENGYAALPLYVDDDHEDEFVFKCLAKKRDMLLSLIHI